MDALGPIFGPSASTAPRDIASIIGHDLDDIVLHVAADTLLFGDRLADVPSVASGVERLAEASRRHVTARVLKQRGINHLGCATMPQRVQLPLVLASRSPQRSAILEQLGIAFEIVVPDVDELTAGDPIEVARANALAKAEAVARDRPQATILGVDTVVALDGEIFGKPPDAKAAEATLKRLSGRTHEVVSGLALLKPGNPQVVHEVTSVTFRTVDDALVRRYVNTGEWSGRAGGYAIQGQGAALVRRIIGDYLNVVGLPVGIMLDLDLTLMLREN